MRPTLVHLTSYRFAPGSHPGIHRTILGLEGHATNVVIAGRSARYSDAPGPAEPGAEEAAPGLHVFQDTIDRLKKPWLARHLAVGLRRRFGPVTAVVGHLGNNGWRALALARALGAPIVTIFHGTDATVDLGAEAYAPLYRGLFRAPGARFLAVADHLRARLVAAGAPAERAATFHLGVDVGAFGPPAREPAPAGAAGGLRLVLVGRMIPVKGHRVALEALQRLEAEHPGHALHLFGDGPLEAELREACARAGLAHAVHFRGVVAPDVLRAELARADVVLQPSVQGPDGMVEGVPNSVLEAMAAGAPVVASRHGGIPEAVADGETGLLVEEGRADALADALRALAADPARRAALGRAGRARVEACFDMHRQGEVLADHCRAAHRDYRALGLLARRRAWRLACQGVLDTTGRRQRMEWELRILANHLRGRIP